MGDISESVPLVTPQPAAPRDPSRMDRGLYGKSSMGGRLRRLVSDLRRSRSATIGVGIVLFWVFVAVAAPLISPYDPYEMEGQRLQLPSQEHWLGTDNLARDVLSRLIWGSRTVLLLAPASVLLGISMGAPLGLASGYLGGTIDTVIMRAGDILLSFPTLLLYILIIATYGASPIIVVISIAIGVVPSITRIVRSLVMDERTRDYVSAARLRGEKLWDILGREILPNASAPILVDTCIRVGYAVMAIGALGFLGLGIPPPTPDWGGMINEGREWIFRQSWMVLAPAAALSSLVIGLNMFADGMREIEQQR
jgi:ABC-type dipeptide/oligopeptide/nickel transport system permease subunit